jgi:hypothetical protein
MCLAQGHQALVHLQTNLKNPHLTMAGLVPEKWFFRGNGTVALVDYDYAICLSYPLCIASSESDTSTMDDTLTKIYIGGTLQAETRTSTP